MRLLNLRTLAVLLVGYVAVFGLLLTAAAMHPLPIVHLPDFGYLRNFQISGAYRFDLELFAIFLWGVWLLWCDRYEVRQALRFLAHCDRVRRYAESMNVPVYFVRISYDKVPK